jgi:hypothetical protein
LVAVAVIDEVIVAVDRQVGIEAGPIEIFAHAVRGIRDLLDRGSRNQIVIVALDHDRIGGLDDHDLPAPGHGPGE